MEETTAPATTATPERVTVAFPTIESLIREKGILPPEELKVFGQQLFSAGPASFTPPANMPVTADYIVGPDDTIVVNVWGRLNETYTLTVQRNGSVYIPQVGSIHVAGLTFKQLVEVIRKEVESVLGVTASVTMGALRSITVFVVGAVKQPGAYTVSAFDTILNALIYSGGPEVKSLLDEWYREKLRQENIDVRQLMERLKKGTTTALTVAPKSAAKTAQYSTLMQLLAILKEERQSEDVIKRVRELDGEQLQKEVESLEVVDVRKEKYANLKQLIEKIKMDKEQAEGLREARCPAARRGIAETGNHRGKSGEGLHSAAAYLRGRAV